MATISSSPQWDSRNRGFISPSELQQMKRASMAGSTSPGPRPNFHQPGHPPPHHSQQSSLDSAPASDPAHSTRLPADASSHTRSTSFFSFRTKSSFDHSQQAPATLQRTPSLDGPSSNTPAGMNVMGNGMAHGPQAQGVGQGHPQAPTQAGQTNGNGLYPQRPPSQQQQQASQGNSVSGKSGSTGGAPSPPPQTQGRPSIDQARRASALGPSGAGNTQQPLHPEIRSVVQLTHAHAHKIYFSGPMVRKIERQPDGQKPHKDEGWVDVWAQLGGTTLSVWDMRAVEEANKQGKEVPPAYVNVQDAFVQVLGSVTVPASPNGPAKKYMNVLTLNTAGSNLLLFSCPTSAALMSWAAALRLTAWEKSRLEEIYTAHLIRITLNDGRNTPSPLMHGRMEGWVRIRIAGQTDWKRLWMVIIAGASDSASTRSSSPATPRKRRMSALFTGGSQDNGKQAGAHGPIMVLLASPKPKDKKKPVLTITNIRQAFAVYPERPELISRSTLMKLEGSIGEEETAAAMRGREGWLLVMPELESGNTQASEMLKWMIGIHDAFELYGRPKAYTWDPRDTASMMFAYPVGPHKDQLFLDRENAEGLDPRDDRTSTIRANLLHILQERMRGVTSPDRPPPVPAGNSNSSHSASAISNRPGSSGGLPNVPSLPPLSFDSVTTPTKANPPTEAERRALTPITERSIPLTEFDTRSFMGDVGGSISGKMSVHGGSVSGNHAAFPSPVREMPDDGTVFGGRLTGSPAMSPTTLASPPRGAENGSPATSTRRRSDDNFSSSVEAANRTASVQMSQRSSMEHINGQAHPAGNGNAQHVDRPSSPFSVLTSPHSPIADNYPRPYSPLNPHALVTNTQPLPQPHSQTTPHPPPAQSQPSPKLTTPTRTLPIYQIPPGGPAPRALPAKQTTAPTLSPAASPTAAPSATPSAPPPDPITAPVAAPTTTSINAPINAPSPQTAFSPAQSPPQSISPPPPPPPLPLALQPSVTSSRKATLNTAMSPPAPPNPPAPLKPVSQFPRDDPKDLIQEAGALYYMQQLDREPEQQTRPQVIPHQSFKSVSSKGAPPSSSHYSDEEDEDLSSHEMLKRENDSSRPASSSNNSDPRHPARRGTPMGLEHLIQSNISASSVVVGTEPGQRTSLTHRPSGARAPPVSRSRLLPNQPSQHRVAEHPEDSSISYTNSQASMHGPNTDDYELSAADAMAALSFMNQEQASLTSSVSDMAKSPPPATHSLPNLPSNDEGPSRDLPNGGNDASGQYRSSFAPSKQAAERRAKTLAQQAAHEVAVTKPGRANGGKGKAPARKQGAWGDSSDEEEEEEEDDEDVDSDGEPSAPSNAGSKASHPKPAGPPPVANIRPLSPRGRGLSPGSRESPGVSPGRGPNTRSNLPRDLPQVPGRYEPEDYLNNQSRQFVAPDQYSDDGRRSHYEDLPPRMQPSPHQPRSQSEYLQQRPQSEYPQQFTASSGYPQGHAARQSMWTQVLEPGKTVTPNENARDTFVQLEPPAQTMTKPFTPHGLLSAGLQDKQDRSAKRQEELARETGASLLNVPNKPPPPQTGLLGAITAHERERKREGGFGAALTEREREKRLAEERQRKLDDFQRQQLEMAQNGGSMYGNQFMNPMMGNPMMMGMGAMSPMMTGMPGAGPMAPLNPMMTGMMGGFANPQHMFAAQQAAQAYQQAMMAFSMAGSQVGGDNGGATSPGPGALSPMMTGMNMGMMGYDPRMSMMGMPMMGGMGGMPGMGMGGMGNMNGMNGMGMQMTGGGGGGYDPRFSASQSQFDLGLRPSGDFNGQSRFSQASSPASPATRPADTGADSPSLSASLGPDHGLADNRTHSPA